MTFQRLWKCLHWCRRVLNVPIWQCQDSGWNYHKMSRMCDIYNVFFKKGIGDDQVFIVSFGFKMVEYIHQSQWYVNKNVPFMCHSCAIQNIFELFTMHSFWLIKDMLIKYGIEISDRQKIVKDNIQTPIIYRNTWQPFCWTN